VQLPERRAGERQGEPARQQQHDQAVQQVEKISRQIRAMRIRG
jgi:hypothetical protein